MTDISIRLFDRANLAWEGKRVTIRDVQLFQIVSLLDMLKAYAFGFYTVALALQALRVRANVFRDTNVNVDEYLKLEFEKLLAALKEECANLSLRHTLNMTLGVESKYRARAYPDKLTYSPDKYTYSDLWNDLDTLDISFSSELREELIFRKRSVTSIENIQKLKDRPLDSPFSRAYPLHCIYRGIHHGSPHIIREVN